MKEKIKRTSIILSPELENKIKFIKRNEGIRSTSEVIYQAVHKNYSKLLAEIKNQ